MAILSILKCLLAFFKPAKHNSASHFLRCWHALLATHEIISVSDLTHKMPQRIGDDDWVLLGAVDYGRIKSGKAQQPRRSQQHLESAMFLSLVTCDAKHAGIIMASYGINGLSTQTLNLKKRKGGNPKNPQPFLLFGSLSLFRVSEFKNEKGFCGAIMAAVRVFGASAGRAFMAAAKSAAKKATASGGAAAKTTEKKTVSNRSATAGIQKVVPVSSELGNFLGASQVSRTEAVKRVWEYIKLQNLQNPTNKKEIFCDAKLKTIFDGKDKVGFTEIARLLSNHFAKSA
ncbi:hypothetical protein VNO77_40429 [Canavalia gladiata]|uniref:DM2 domain-containing protein n=1 Tax=Canavalia gladiata TaxID=3824 RepID=A0AAN9K0N3_CANGL